MKAILVRHGETDANVEGRYAGWADVALTEKGVEQAHYAKERLKGQKIDLIVTSDLVRARHTAQIINEAYGCEIKVDEAFREMSFGVWELLTLEDIKAQSPEQLQLWWDDYLDYCTPEGESVRGLYNRVNGAFEEYKKAYEGKTVMFVSHSGVMRGILSKEISGNVDGYWKFKVENCGISIIEYVDGFPVLLIK